MKKLKISANVIRRLPRYLQYLDRLQDAGVVRISSGEMGRQMGFTASQIRQDFSYFGEFGQQGYGYNVETLRREIADILGMSRLRTAVMIGAGNLGHALMRNFHFAECGFQLTAAFDVDPVMIGTAVRDIPILSMDALESYIAANSPDVAILTLPGNQVETVARRLADCGVRGIWNFTNEELKSAREDIVVENVNFSDSLLTLGYYLANRRNGSEQEDRN